MKRLLAARWAVAVCISAVLTAGALADESEKNARRFGQVIRLKPEKIEYYKELHANTWPGVLKAVSEANIRNYSIFLKQLDDDRWYLFAYFEYAGDDFDGDMAKVAADPEVKRWWKETDPCQIPIAKRAEGEWWSNMEEVFHYP